jgi:hypothetical protein
MGAQFLVTAGLVGRGIGVQVAERRREAIATMLTGCAAQAPQRVLQALGQGGEALAAENHFGMRPAGEGQAEVIEPMHESGAGDRHTELADVGEVGQSLQTGRVLLAENHVLVRAVQSSPHPDPPLQRAANAVSQLGVTTHELPEDADRPQTRRGLEHRHDLAVPNAGQGIRPTAAA